jgi:hypothetical protein
MYSRGASPRVRRGQLHAIQRKLTVVMVPTQRETRPPRYWHLAGDLCFPVIRREPNWIQRSCSRSQTNAFGCGNLHSSHRR